MAEMQTQDRSPLVLVNVYPLMYLAKTVICSECNQSWESNLLIHLSNHNSIWNSSHNGLKKDDSLPFVVSSGANVRRPQGEKFQSAIQGEFRT